MKNKVTDQTPRYPLRAAARRILRGQTSRAERIFHCRAAFLATLGLSAVGEEVPRSEFRVSSPTETRRAAHR